MWAISYEGRLDLVTKYKTESHANRAVSELVEELWGWDFTAMVEDPASLEEFAKYEVVKVG